MPMLDSTRRGAAAAAALATAALAVAAGAFSGPSDAATRTTPPFLLSRSTSGGIPNGPSLRPAISGDKRYARVVAFDSTASNLVGGDVNGFSDVFAVVRAGSYGNDGTPWSPGRTMLVSRGRGGQPANGPSFAAAVDGNYRHRGSCVGFLSAASNLVGGDTNGRIDAFVSRGPGGAPTRVSLPHDRQSTKDTTQLAVSGDCSRFAFVTGGQLFVRSGNHTRQLRTSGTPSDPSFATGETNDLVFAAPAGVYLARGGTGSPQLIAPGGSDPAYNAIKRPVVAYERQIGGHSQVAFRDLGRGEQVASSYNGQVGDGNSVDPVIGNSGYYILFQTSATNLGTNAARRRLDTNGAPDVYLYTDVRKLTTLQSFESYDHPLPGGGEHPGLSFYANYLVFDSPAPLGRPDGNRQVFMRWLGGK